MTPTIKPTIKQHQAWSLLQDDKVKYLLFGGGAGSGKSWLGCEWVLTQCYFYPGSRWFIARNELKRLMNSTFVTWGKVCKHHNIPADDWSLDGKYNVIRFKNGSTVDLLDVAFKPTDAMYERFGSTEYTGGFIEEAGEVKFEAFDVLKSRIGRHMGDLVKPKLLLTCNPNRGWLYHTFYKPWRTNTLPPGYAFVQALYTDNPYTAKSYGETLSSIRNQVNRARLMNGDWEYADQAGAMVSYEALTDMFTNTINKKGTKYLTVDVARHGDDRTVISLWEDWELVEVDTYEKQNTEQTEQRIRDKALVNRVPYSQIIIDEDGIGGGVVDHLQGVRGFVANSTPLLTASQIRMRNRGQIVNEFTPKTNFANLKAQCAFKLAELINDHKIAIRVDQHRDNIIEELSATLQEKDLDKDNKLQLRPKDEVRQELGRSPDIGDTLIMRAWFELKSESTGHNDEAHAVAVHKQVNQFSMRENLYHLNSGR